jgi:hypothetical protein
LTASSSVTVMSLKRLLDASGLTHPCDLDLALFFYRHQGALMTSDNIAAFLGYDVTELAKSLDLLVERRVLARSQNHTNSVRLYRFTNEHADASLRALLEVASTLEGRRRLRRLLREDARA